MSERGSFVTEYIYCEECFDAVKRVLQGSGKYLTSYQIPKSDGGGFYPILAGKIGGLYPGEEISTFENEYVPKLEKLICHPVRIAVIAETGEQIFTVQPYTE